MPSSLKDIYNALREDQQFSQTKDYGTFAKRMNERGYSQMIYNNLKTAGASLPDVNTFRKRLGLKDWSAPSTKPVAKSKSQATPSYADYSAMSLSPSSASQGNGVKDKYRYPGLSVPMNTNGTEDTTSSGNESALVRSLRKTGSRKNQPSLRKPIGKVMVENHDKETVNLSGAASEIANEGAKPAYNLGDETTSLYLSKRKSDVAKEHDKVRSVSEAVWDNASKVAGDEFNDYIKDRNEMNFTNVVRELAKGSNPSRMSEDNWEVGTEAMASHLRNHDLEKLSEAAWNALGENGQKDLINDYYSKILQQYPHADHNEVYEEAKKMARAESDNQMYQTAVSKNAPKDVADFFFRKAARTNSVGNIMEANARIKAGTRGDMDARDEADARYEQDHKVAGIAGMAAGFATDPLTAVSGGVGSATAKGATALAGKAFGQAAVRKFGTTLGGKILTGAAAGMGNLGTLEAGSNAAEQLRQGGWRDDEGKFHEGFAEGQVLKQGLHGAGMGALTGVVSPVIGNVADKAVRATSNTAGKIGIRAGEVGTSILAEGTIFSVPEWMEGKRDKMDVWTDNLAQMAGMKVQGGFKTVANTIAGLHGNAKTGFRERLNGILDGNRQDLALTKDERAELEQGGYTDLKQLTDDAVASKGKKTATKDGKTATTSDDGKNVPVNRFEQLMADKNISEAARAKMYYYLTGHTLPMSTVTGGSMSVTKDADGKVTGYTVESTGYNGVITRRHFSDRKSADREMDRVHRQAELNNVGIGEHLYDEKAVKDGKPIEEGSAKLRSDIMDEYGIDVNEAYKKPYDKRSEEEQRAIDAYSDRLYDVTRNAEPAEDADPIGLSVAEREGADIVEENHLGTETPDTEVVQSTVTELRQAQTAWTEAMKSDTSLAEGFKTAQEKGLGMVEAYEWMLEQGYGTEESLAPLADVISASVKVVSMWRGTKESIEKTTQEHVSTWQWEGTDFGQGEATEPTMLYVTGKNGHRLIVKSGHIKFDAKGNAIEGDMIICLDETTGDMVHPSVKDVKFQGTESAKDYADRYRQRLQEINSKGYETLPVTPAEAESKPEGKATPEGMTEPESPLTEEPAKTEPSEANQDIPTEGEPETPDNGKIEGNYDKESGIPLDEEGEPLYEQVPKEQTVEDIFGKLDDANLARDYAKHKVSEAEKKLKSVSGKAPKMGTKINEYARKKTEYEAKVKEAQASVDYWKSVVEDIEKLTHTTDEELAEQKRELDGTAAKEEMKDNHETDVPDSGVALAASVLADAKITPDSLKKETGYGTKDLNRFVGMLAKKENGGVDLISLAEKLVEMDEQYNNRFFGGDAQEARNALLEALGQAKTRGELRALARPDEAKAIKEREEQRDKAYHDAYGMSYEEYLDFAEQEMAHLIGDMAHFDEEKYLQDYAAEITKQIDKEHGTGIKGHESAGEEPVHGTGGEVLSGEGVDDRGGSGSVEGHGEGKEEVRGGDRADAALEEEASGEVDEAHPIEGKESKPQSLKQERESHAHPKQSLKERTRKACESVAKELGVDIEWVDHLEDNGLFTTKDENGDNLARPLIRIARDAENPLTTVFGHEGIHAVRNLSEEAYQSLIKTAMSVVGDAEWQKRFDATKERYKKQNLTDDEIAEEVVADIVGEMITNRDMTEKIASRLSHPVLSALRDVAHKIWEAIKTFVGKGTTLNEQEQAVKDFTDTIERAFVEAKKKAKEREVYANEATVPPTRQVSEVLSQNSKDYDPVSVPWGKGDLVGNNTAPTRYSSRASIEGAGLKPNTDDGGRVTYSFGGKKFDKDHPVTPNDLKRIHSPFMSLVKYCEEAGTLKDADVVVSKYCDLLNLFLKKGDKGFDALSDEFAWSGEALFKTVSNNSDAQYKKSVDITRLCKKNEAVIYAICELQKRQGYGATPGQILDIYEATNDQGYQVPCPVCYVFSRYVANGQYATALISGQKFFGKYLKDPSTMTPKQREKYVADWCARLAEVKAWKAKNSKAIAQAKSDIITILQQVDAISEDITSGKLKGDALTVAKQHIRALDKLYRDALNLTAKASLDGWITNIAIMKKGGKKIAEEAESSDTEEVLSVDPKDYDAREDSWRAYPEDMALDLRKTAEAEREYPGIVRFRRTRGAAAGKAIQFAADNKIGELVELLGKSGIEDKNKNYSALQKAFAETDEATRNKYLKEAQTNIRNAVIYAARQSLRGGIRQWSWSDNIERLMPDVFINLLQEHMLGAAVQAYSKQLEGIEMVAAMNGYINGSLMGKGLGIREVSADYTDGPVYYEPRDGKYYTLEFDNVVGVEPFSRDGKLGLFDLNKMYDRAGNILVGMSDTHVRAALADPRIFFVIPWHASGANNHVLMQMYKFLGIDTTDLSRNATDYTKTQEDKRFSASDNVTSSDREVWEEHNHNDKYKCGIGTIESGTVDTVDGKRVIRLSEGQKRYRALRDAILTIDMRKPITSLTDAQRKKLTEEREAGSSVTEAERIAELEAERQRNLKEIENDEFLSQVIRKQERLHEMGTTMEKEDCNHIYPYEYWDETSTFDTADVNGERYLEYCRRMGFRPKFCGIADGKRGDTGNFVNDKGYWKLLIDRRMYKCDGNFQDLTSVTVDGFSTDLIDRDVIEKRVPVTRVANGDETNGIVDQVQEAERQRGLNSKQFVPQVNYDMSFDKATERYQKTSDRESILSNTRKYIEGKNMKKAEARAKAKADLEKRKAKGAKYSLREEAPTGEAENENNQSIEDVKKTDNEAFHHYSVASESESSTVEHGPADVAEHVAKVAEKTGGKVEQVNSIEEITNEKVKADIAKGKKVQGWYDEKTGKVYLYMPNIHDRYTAERVVWHETVGHKGMRGLLGDEGFKQYMQSLWYDLDNPVNAELRQYVRDRMAKDHLSMYDAIEEFIAESAEKGKGTAGFWNNVKNKVSDVLHEIGYRISPNVKDVQYMLWLAKNVQKNPNDPVWKMRAEAAKWKIEHSDMHLSEERGGEIADTGVHKSTDGMTDAEIERETDCKVHYSTAPSTATEIDLYNRAVGNVRAMLKESYQDSMNSLTELMKVLIPGMKRVEDVRATLNPRMMENLMAGRISAKGRKFANQEMKRLDRAYVGVLDAFNGKNTEERMREASLYMIEKHGLERNRVFYVRDKIAKERESDSMFADQLQQDWNVKKKELGDKLRNGQIDLKEYYKQMDEWIRGNVDRNYIASEHDYSGMHGMQGIANLRDAYDDAGAIAHVMDCEAKMEGNKKGSVAVLWSATKDATNFSIHEEYSSGYLSKDRYESLRDMFDWYVPLRKYDETTMEDVYTYIHGHVGSSNSIGMTVQKAKGRKSLSDVNILAQIGAMASGALYRGGSNEVRQAFARMVGEYEKAPANERVVTEIKGWAVKTTDSNGNIVWTEAHPPIPADDTNQETIAQEYYNWNQQMEAKKATGDAVEITGQSNIPYKFLPKGDRSQHIVSVWINGKRRDYLINGNPRAAQALNGMLNNESAKGALSAVNRFLAQSVTSWNPEFTLRNTVRDFGFASHLLEAKEGVNYWSKFEKHFFAMGLAPVGRTITAKSMNDVKNGLFVNLFKRYEQGTLDSNKPYHKWFAEFMDNGGMTGIATQQRFDEWKKKVVKDVAKMREGYMRHPWTLTKDIFSTIEVANEMAENITRFATFCASRESGRTAARSAYDAHEVSVNFNTRGSGNAVKTYSYEGMGDSAKALRNATGFFTGWMRNYTMFFNASVQSFCAFSRNIKAHPVRATATLMALPFAVGALMPWVNGLMQAWCDSDEDKKKLGIPDDPYGELPEFIRRDNLCFYIGKGEFVTVPLGIETRAFYGLGDLAAGYTFHPELQSQKNVAMDVAGQLSQIVPVGDFMSGSSFGDNAKGDAVTVLNKFLPSMYTPLSELVFNIDWKGQPIMRDGDYLDNSPSWMRAPRGTLTPLVKLNKKVNAETNDIMPGNENMKGDEVLDAMTNPALIEHLLDSYVGGTGTFVKRTGKVVNRAIIKAQGGNADIESKDIPFVRSLLYTPSETNAMARTKAKWYKYKEDIEKDAANMKVLKRRDVPLDEQIANFAQLQKLQNNANAQRVNIYERASKQIKRLNKRKARAQDDEESKYFDQQVNMIMEDAVKEMDAIKDK